MQRDKNPLNGPELRTKSFSTSQFRAELALNLSLYVVSDAPAWCLLSSKSTRIDQPRTVCKQTLKGPSAMFDGQKYLCYDFPSHSLVSNFLFLVYSNTRELVYACSYSVGDLSA